MYSIDTALIKEAFNKKCECPLCEMEKTVEEEFVHEFLNDAVMQSESRSLVNDLGFCAKHYETMMNRPNKLSLAVQTNSRIFSLGKILKTEKSVKGAINQAKKLQSATRSCVICELTKESMEKYYKRIAKLYEEDEIFRVAFANCNGFCLKHYPLLLLHAKNANKYADEYVKILTEIQIRAFNSLSVDLSDFCAHHDYRNAYKPLGNAENVLQRAKRKLFGKDNN